MDAAGTAAGVVSLGITLCEGIIRYCHGWKQQDQDIKTLRELTDGLLRVLREVDNWLSRQSSLDPALHAAAGSSLKACNDQISKAAAICDKYSTGRTTSSKKEKLKELIRKLKFPFEREVLGELREIVMALRGNVDLTILQINTQLSAAGLDEIRQLRNENDDKHQVIVAEIRNSTTQIAQTFTSECEQKMVTPFVQRIESSADSTKDAITESSAAILSQLTARSNELTATIASYHAAVLQAVNAKEDQVSEALEYPSSSISLNSNMPRKRKKARRHSAAGQGSSSICTCTSRVTQWNAGTGESWTFQSRFPALYISKTTETHIMHDRECPLWFTSSVNSTYKFRSQAFNWGLFSSVKVSKSVCNIFLGRNISASLRLMPVVPSSSPIDRVINNYMPYITDSQELSRLIRDLMIVFRSGQGSPWDTKEHGQRLLGALFWFMFIRCPHLLDQLFRDLKLMHINTDEIIIANEAERSYFYTSVTIEDGFGVFIPFPEHDVKYLALLYSEQSVGYSRALVSPNLWECRNSRTNSNQRAIQLLKTSADILELSGCGELSKAILRRDISQVKTILLSKPYLIKTERNMYCQPPMFLAVGWPDGLRLILDTVKEFSYPMNRCDIATDITTLDHAISSGCVESVKLLATTDITFDSRWSFIIGREVQSPVSELLLKMFKDRCYQLQAFSLKHLPEQIVSFLDLTNLEEFLTHAMIVLHYLKTMGVTIPSKFCSQKWIPVSFRPGLEYPRVSFCPEYGNIFHQFCLSGSATQAFYNYGFRGIDTPCKQLTPLMCQVTHRYDAQCDAKYIEFLVRNGAKLDREIPTRYIKGNQRVADTHGSRHRTIHRVSVAVFGRYWRFLPLGSLKRVECLLSSDLLRDMFTSTESDPCLCACSLKGCRPISLVLKPYYIQDRRLGSSSSAVRETRRIRTQHLAADVGDLQGPLLAEDVIRVLTFNALGLTHTCCRHMTDFTPNICVGDLERESLRRSKHNLGPYFTDSPDEFQHVEGRDPVMISLMDPTEIDEIREEEAPLIARLDNMVAKFMEKFEEQAVPLPGFLTSYWLTEMDAELSAKDEVPQDDRRAMLDIGVRLQEVDEKVEKAKPKEDDYEEWIRGLEASLS